MMANNWKRLNVWLTLQDRTNYAEYKAACEAVGTAPHGAHEFAQKIGMVMCGMSAYPELPVAEAYLKFIRENQEAFTPPTQQNTQMPEVPYGYKKELVTITFGDGRTEQQEILIPDVQKTGCCGGGEVR